MRVMAFSKRMNGIGLVVALGATQALSAEYCVNSPANFQTALDAAKVNGEASNTIKVKAGNYLLTTGLNYITSTTSSLNIIGGYAAGCPAMTGEATVLDGQHSVRPLYVVAPNTNVRIEGLDFAGGLSTNNRGGGLSVSSNLGTVRIERNRFYGNRADDFGGGLYANCGGTLHVLNNVFFGNTAAVDGAAELFSTSSESYVNSNTIIANSADTATGVGGVRMGGNTHYNVSNNIFWNNNANGAVDVFFATGHLVNNNDWGTVAGGPPDVASFGNVSLDPQFAACGIFCVSYSLARSSPLIDAGFNFPPGGLTSVDIFGRPRIDSGVVDIGAAEFTILFANGFE
jgi:hypothetical protein